MNFQVLILLTGLLSTAVVRDCRGTTEVGNFTASSSYFSPASWDNALAVSDARFFWYSPLIFALLKAIHTSIARQRVVRELVQQDRARIINPFIVAVIHEQLARAGVLHAERYKVFYGDSIFQRVQEAIAFIEYRAQAVFISSTMIRSCEQIQQLLINQIGHSPEQKDVATVQALYARITPEEAIQYARDIENFFALKFIMRHEGAHVVYVHDRERWAKWMPLVSSMQLLGGYIGQQAIEVLLPKLCAKASLRLIVRYALIYARQSLLTSTALRASFRSLLLQEQAADHHALLSTQDPDECFLTANFYEHYGQEVVGNRLRSLQNFFDRLGTSKSLMPPLRSWRSVYRLVKVQPLALNTLWYFLYSRPSGMDVREDPRAYAALDPIHPMPSLRAKKIREHGKMLQKNRQTTQ